MKNYKRYKQRYLLLITIAIISICVTSAILFFQDDLFQTEIISPRKLSIKGTVHCSRSSTHCPNIILIMTDDQGWGQTGYYNHPVLKTPNLDTMAANGLRFDRFYAGAPVCSPTRASILTGRSNDRTGVPDHGFALRLEEITLPSVLKAFGYSTGHFGKWHLNGLRGPGVPVLGDDKYSPGAFGFDEWLSVTNYFDMNPIMSRKGVFEELEGDTSKIIVDEAIRFISASIKNGNPFFAVIWDAAPHKPWKASQTDKISFGMLDADSQNHYGELVAFDRSVGVLRNSLRDLGIENNTLVWFFSDNGGLNGITPGTVAGLRGFKGSLWEGGIRVPAIIEWPAVIKPRTTNYPASTMDVFATITDILNLPATASLEPIDGISLYPLFAHDIGKRDYPIFFRYRGMGALIDNEYKLITTDISKDEYMLFDISVDQIESSDISSENAITFERMKSMYKTWNTTVEDSIAGKDYPEGIVYKSRPKPHLWTNDERYKLFIKEWRMRPEYNEWIQ